MPGKYCLSSSCFDTCFLYSNKSLLKIFSDCFVFVSIATPFEGTDKEEYSGKETVVRQFR